MAPRSSFPNYDRILDGQLGEILLKLRADGLTFTEIAGRLRVTYEITVSHETVRRWIQQLGAAA